MSKTRCSLTTRNSLAIHNNRCQPSRQILRRTSLSHKIPTTHRSASRKSTERLVVVPQNLTKKVSRHPPRPRENRNCTSRRKKKRLHRFRKTYKEPNHTASGGRKYRMSCKLIEYWISIQAFSQIATRLISQTPAQLRPIITIRCLTTQT